MSRSDAHSKEGKKPMSALRWVLIILCLCVAGFSGWKLYGMVMEYREGSETYENIANNVIIDPSANSNTSPGENSDPYNYVDNVEDNEPDEEPIPEIDFGALKEISKQAVGWIHLPDSVISYPVAKAKDNVFYLDHTLDGKTNKAGCLFVDYRNADGFSDRNTVIYGHHMRNGKMFTGLHRYKDQEYYDSHQMFYFTIEDGKYLLLPFAGYTTTATSDAYKRTFKNDKEYDEWLKKIVKRSNFKTEIEVSTEDIIVTLSTCAYNYDNARYVVHTKLIKYEDSLGSAYEFAAN